MYPRGCDELFRRRNMYLRGVDALFLGAYGCVVASISSTLRPGAVEPQSRPIQEEQSESRCVSSVLRERVIHRERTSFES